MFSWRVWRLLEDKFQLGGRINLTLEGGSQRQSRAKGLIFEWEASNFKEEAFRMALKKTS